MTFLRRRFDSNQLRSFVFGVEDSLVSTVGLISGIAASGVEKPIILLTGTILIFVEAFSMAVGEFLSDNAAKEYDAHKPTPLAPSVVQGVIMFTAYICSGFVVLVPYMAVADTSLAIIISIAASLLALFALGATSAELSHTSIVRKGITMTVVGGAAIFVGIIIGNIVAL